MIVEEIDADKFLGSSFSDSGVFRIPRQPFINNRNGRLAELVKGKSVLHVGCADHVMIIEEKIRKGIYLHKLLENSADKVIGVDTSAEGIAKMQKLGFSEVYTVDEFPPPPFLFNTLYALMSLSMC